MELRIPRLVEAKILSVKIGKECHVGFIGEFACPKYVKDAWVFVITGAGAPLRLKGLVELWRSWGRKRKGWLLTTSTNVSS
jgi:hypothetical protein